MKMLLFLIAIFASTYACTQPQKTEAVKLPSSDSIRTLMGKSKVPILGIGVIENGQVKAVNMLGELRPGVAANEQTLFNVASLTKPVVAITALRLIDAGKWSLDEPLDKYWIDPDIKDDPRHRLLTTRIVLSHQTGFANWRAGKLAFGFTPGTAYGYSGEGYEYLRHALESKFGRTLQSLSDSVLFSQAGIKDTRYGWQPGMDTTRYAPPYDKTGKQLTIIKHTLPNAADWLVTTVPNYTRFGAYVIQGAGISQQLFDDMVTQQSKAMTADNAMGLGWGLRMNLSNGEYALLHTGHDPGVSTMIVLLPGPNEDWCYYPMGTVPLKCLSK